jgi:hypothetical protein
LRKLLEGDEDEDCGEDDPPAKAYADNYPVHGRWTPAAWHPMAGHPMSAHQGWEGPCTPWADETW